MKKIILFLILTIFISNCTSFSTNTYKDWNGKLKGNVNIGW